MDIDDLTDLPRPIRLRVVAAAAKQYIGQARCREDAAAATENILIVLMRMILGGAARTNMPVPAQGGLRAQISRASDRFTELLRHEIKKAHGAPCLSRITDFSKMSEIKRETLSPRGYRKLHRRLLAVPEFSGVAALLLAGVELILTRSMAAFREERLAKKSSRKFKQSVLKMP